MPAPFAMTLVAALLAPVTGGGGLSPTFNLDFTSTLPAQVTFSRTGSRTAIVNGVVTTVSSGSPAIESWNGVNQGLSIDPASTNSALQSNTFTTSWSTSNLTPTSGLAGPDGTSSGWQLTEAAVSGYHELSQNFSAVGSGVTITTSMFLKQMAGSATGSGGLFNCNQFDNTGARTVGMVDGSNMAYSFDTKAIGGVAGTFNNVSSGCQALANGWTRVWITGTTTSSGTKTIRLRTMQTTASPPGENFAGSTSNGVLAAFGQVEFGVSKPTSYKATTTGTIATNADVASITDLSWLNTAQGTIYIEHDVSNGSAVIGSGANTVVPGTAAGKTAFAWSGTTSDLVNNGGSTATGANPSFSTALQLLAANGITTGGHIKVFKYYPTRMTVLQMQALTAKASTATPGVMRIAVDHAKMANATSSISGTTPSMAIDVRRTIWGDRTKLRIAVGNWFCNDVGGDQAIPNTVNVSVALVRVATGEVAQVLFSGTQAYAMPAGTVLQESDDILPSAFPSLAAGGVFPDSDVVRIKTIISCATGGAFPVGTYSGETNTLAATYDASVTTISALNSSTSFTTVSGTNALVLVGAQKCFCPVLVGQFASGDPASLMATGDSIFEGLVAGLQTAGTWVQTAARNLKMPMLIYALGGNSQIYTWKSTNLYQWMRYARILVDNNGTNTLDGPRYPLSYSKARGAGIAYILRPSLLQRASSTDNFATNANQTSSFIYPNTNDISLKGLYDNGYIDAFYKTVCTRDTGDKWISDGNPNTYTVDGTHPTVAADALMATELQPYLAAAAAALT